MLDTSPVLDNHLSQPQIAYATAGIAVHVCNDAVEDQGSREGWIPASQRFSLQLGTQLSATAQPMAVFRLVTLLSATGIGRSGSR